MNDETDRLRRSSWSTVWIDSRWIDAVVATSISAVTPPAGHALICGSTACSAIDTSSGLAVPAR